MPKTDHTDAGGTAVADRAKLLHTRLSDATPVGKRVQLGGPLNWNWLYQRAGVREAEQRALGAALGIIAQDPTPKGAPDEA